MRAEFRHTFLRDTTTFHTRNSPNASEKFEIPNCSTPFASICNKMHQSANDFLPAANFTEPTHSLLDPGGAEKLPTRIRGIILFLSCGRELQAQFRSTSSSATSFWVPSGRSKLFDEHYPRFDIFLPFPYIRSEFLLRIRYLQWPD